MASCRRSPYEPIAVPKHACGRRHPSGVSRTDLADGTGQRTGEVHAFEELVGCHGGLGGWQNEAVLVHPADWPVDPDLLEHSGGDGVLYGPDAVHRQLIRWLERCGARQPPTPRPDAVEPVG
jgi:hypothetical protein